MTVVVVIPFRPAGRDRAAALAHVLGCYRWPVVVADSSGCWSKGAAVDRAVRTVSADVLVIADGDVIPPDCMGDAVDAVLSGAAGWAVPHRFVHRLDRESTAALLDGAPPRRPGLCRGPYVGVAGGGIVVVSSDAYRAVGGIDQRFKVRGEDMAFGWALETLAGPGVRLDGRLVHLWHPEQTYQSGWCAADQRLRDRYRAARHDVAAMSALVREPR